MQRPTDPHIPVTPPTPTPPPPPVVAAPPYRPPQPGVYYPPRPPKPQLASDRRDIRLTIALILLSVISINLSVYGGFHIGFALSFAAMLLCGGLYLRGQYTRLSPYALFCAVATLAGTGVFVWHNDEVIKFYTFCGMTVLTMLALANSTGAARRDRGSVSSLLDVWELLLIRPLSHVGTAIPAIFRVKQGDHIEKRRSGGVFLGLLCALPVLVVVIPLLVSADAAFEGLLQHTVLDNLGELFGSLLLGVGLFCLLFSRWFNLRHGLTKERPAQTKERRGVDRLAINAFLAAIGGVYVLYLLSQLAYFFSAFSGILPAEYTVAQYARRGFFEMCCLCTINLGLLAGSLALSRKEAGRVPLSTRLFCLFILLFSLGLVAVALSKMVLYIDSFGMTRLRILTSVVMLMLGLILVFVCIRLFAAKFPYMQAIVAAVAILGLTVAYGDVDTLVAGYNVQAYRSGQLETVDVAMLANLSDGAIPYLVELLEDEDDTVATEAAHHLAKQLYRHGDIEGDTFIPDATTDWRQYNIDAARARALLTENASAIIAGESAYYSYSIY